MLGGTDVRKTIGLAATAVLLLSVAGGTPQACPGPWRIATLAGGVGGPAPAGQIGAGACALSFADGNLYAMSSGYGFFATAGRPHRAGSTTRPGSR